MNKKEVLILGAGLTGLSAGWCYGKGAVILEKESRPGGLVRTEKIGSYFFDQVPHILYFHDATIQDRIIQLLGGDLVSCILEAYVDTDYGISRYPIQNHLVDLENSMIQKILVDLAKLSYEPNHNNIENYHDFLLQNFGENLFKIFFEPYNKKMWKRDLKEIVPNNISWNINRPNFPEILAGALNSTSSTNAYNSIGWFPNPKLESPVRGMEVLSVAIANKCHDIRLNSEIISIDLKCKEIIVLENNESERVYHYDQYCLSSLPLPVLIKKTKNVPDFLKKQVETLKHNNVLILGIALEGIRPNLGHCRYYPNLDLIFTRLTFPYRFDPNLAPVNGWSILVEIPISSKQPKPNLNELLEKIKKDLKKVGILQETIVDHIWIESNPAYVIFEKGQDEIIKNARSYYSVQGITSLGRYGKWGYTSMEDAIKDGLNWAEKIKK
ncbi:hypothetical protein F889_00061 [Acinetobacter colistiniresistens]|uniref:Amine oxidase domain-containing protein n=1 Tax=Acinetobacter colistiniresistens TaxID=280145 RepID=N9RDV1_9GAMM|nr:FAD-dependent oxidoreductase [Acinetobacter colistiniresistens]ENX36810.1 hypothetical protein F889_00061 [Acinetobacter colistiniresistens]